MFNFNLSIKTHLTLFIVGTVLILQLIMFGLIIYDQSKDNHKDALTSVSSIGSLVQTSLNRIFRHQRERFVQEVLSELHVLNEIEYVAIVNKEQSILFSHHEIDVGTQIHKQVWEFKPEVFQYVLDTGISQFEFDMETNHVVAYIPILSSEANGDSRYILVFNYNTFKSFNYLLTQKKHEIFIMLLLMFFVGIFLWFWINKKITKPIRQLENDIHKIESSHNLKFIGDYEENEVGRLAKTIFALSAERFVSEERLKKLSMAVEQSNESILVTDPLGIIEYVNKAFTENTGYSFEEVVGKNPKILQSGKTPKEVYDEMWDKLSSGQSWKGELHNRTKSGADYIEWATISPIFDEKGEISHFVGIKQNITKQKEHEAKLNQLAYYDALTNLPNRACLTEIINDKLEVLTGESKFGAILLLDIDRFQNINDARGYKSGDELLNQVADRLRSATNENCTLSRLGSDLFAAFSDLAFDSKGVAIEHGKSLSEQLLALMQRPFFVLDEEISITVSVGVAIVNDGDAELLLRHLETALHEAKFLGGNQAAIYESSFGLAAEERFELQRDLYSTISNGELRLYFQNQVNYNGELKGAEALVRWQHPTRGLVSPGVFIPLAEETDLIVDIGCWVLTQALLTIVNNDLKGIAVNISVNMSPRHFRKVGFIPWLKEMLNKTGANANHLILEVTEGISVGNIADLVAKMDELKELGVRFSLDDFGTGYSSLSYLKRLPFYELKIDQSFIRDVVEDPSDAALVDTIVSVARNMGMKVVAEGVETKEQADFLNQYGEIIYQGYYYAKPIPVEEWTKELLLKH